MRILGIDPGIGITGWSIVDYVNKTPNLFAAGIVKTKVNSPTPGRLLNLYKELNRLVDNYSPQEIAIEKLFFARNVTTAMTVSQARGIVLLVGAQHNLLIGEYTPLQIKMAIAGYGRATKKQIMIMLAQHVKNTPIPAQDDAADAVAVAVTHTIVKG